MKNIKVSIITPLYNAESFISETIDSVLCQTFQDWELILVDDCSSDNTVLFVQSKYNNDRRIKLIKAEKNGGAGISRNLGLKVASAKLIAFLDADDVWLPNKLEKQIKFMKLHDSPIVHTSYSFIDEDGNEIPGHVSVSKNVDLNSYMRNTEIGMSTSLINIDIVGSFQFDSMRTRQDTNLWLNLLGNGHIAHGLDESLVKYRIRKGQISGNKLIIAWRTLKVYLSVTNISLFQRLLNFCHYAFNGVFKRLKK